MTLHGKSLRVIMVNGVPWGLPRHSIHHDTPKAFPNDVPLYTIYTLYTIHYSSYYTVLGCLGTLDAAAGQVALWAHKTAWGNNILGFKVYQMI